MQKLDAELRDVILPQKCRSVSTVEESLSSSTALKSSLSLFRSLCIVIEFKYKTIDQLTQHVFKSNRVHLFIYTPQGCRPIMLHKIKHFLWWF